VNFRSASERKREIEGEKGRERDRECVCVCVRERERKRERVSERERERERVRERGRLGGEMKEKSGDELRAEAAERMHLTQPNDSKSNHIKSNQVKAIEGSCLLSSPPTTLLLTWFRLWNWF
jgi:hypothetical protein